MSFYFGEFELDQERRQLLREGEPVPLEPKAYELLNLLLERRPRALSRAHIRDAIWAGTYVSESTLGVAVNAIRQALGDEARKPRFIRTVHGFGYAFCGEARESAGDRREPADRLAVEARPSSDVSPREEAKPIDGPFPGPSAMASPPRWRLAVIGAGVLVLLAGGWLAIRRMKSSDVPARVPAPKVVPLTSLPGHSTV